MLKGINFKVTAKPPKRTKQQIAEYTQRIWDLYKPYTPLSMSDDLKAKLIPHALINVPQHILDELHDCMDDMENWQSTKSKHLKEVLESLVPYQSNFFGKLITRSPKDIHDISVPFDSPSSFWTAFFNSERCVDDIYSCVAFEQDRFYLIFSEFQHIEPLTEFRFFWSDNKITAASQYADPYSLEETLSDTLGHIFFDEALAFVNSLSLPNYPASVDVCRINKVWYLIEINPFHLSNPCLLQEPNSNIFAYYDGFDKMVKHIALP